jgi:long-chain fatty acid transport protein
MRFRPGRSFALLAVLAAPAVLPAQGFGLNEIGTCAVARASATTGAPCNDASSIFWQPAFGTRLEGLQVYAGLAAIALGGDFTADRTLRVDEADVPTEFPPHLFVNWKSPARRYAVGLGVYVPYGLTSQWKQDFPGRFLAQRASLATIYVQPNLSIDITKNWSIGGGPVIGHSTVELKQSLDLSQQGLPGRPGLTFANLGIAPGTEFARASLEGGAFGYGFHVGVHGRFAERWQVGGRFISSMEFRYEDADAAFEQVATGLIIPDGTVFGVPNGTPYDAVLAPSFAGTGALTSQKVETAITHPGQAQVGVGYRAAFGTLFSADYSYIIWSKFKELPLAFQGPARASSRYLIEDYDNSSSVKFGLEHEFAGLATARGGISWVQTPAPDETVTPLLPDQDRMNYAIGLGLPLGGRFVVDASYLKVDTEGRRGRIAERTSYSQTAEQLNSGFYRLRANIFSLSLKARF